MSTIVLGKNFLCPKLRKVFYGEPDDFIINESSRIINGHNYGNHLFELWGYLRDSVLDCTPEDFDMARVKYEEVVHTLKPRVVINQNIDGLLGASLPEGTRLVEPYGNVFRMKCLRCGHEMSITTNDYAFLRSSDALCCEKCGKDRLRPDICLPQESMRRKSKMRHNMKQATHVVYLDVVNDDSPLARMYNNAAHSVLVSNEPWGAFDKNIQMSTDEWIKYELPL